MIITRIAPMTVAVAAAAWLLTGCTDDRLAGGGTETGNAGVVSGRLLDSDGRGVAGAALSLQEVRLQSDGSEAGALFSSVTDDTGAYRFRDVAAGEYALYAAGSGDAPQAAILTRIGKSDSAVALPDAVARRTVTLEGRVLPGTARPEEVLVCIPGTGSCARPGADSVWRIPSAPKGAYELLYLTPTAVHYLGVQVRAETGSTVYVRDALLRDSADAGRIPYRFYDLPRTLSFAFVPTAYPIGGEPAWYADKNFADVNYFLLSGTGADAAWDPDYLGSWLYSRTLDADSLRTGADLSGPLAGFPCLVRLSSPGFDFSQALPGGGDVAFSDTTGRLLPFEIERWDAAVGRAEIWVRVDTLPARRDGRKVRMHWGNASDTLHPDGSAVFRAADGFLGAWHLAGADADGGSAAGSIAAEARGLYAGLLAGPLPGGGYPAVWTAQGATGPGLALGNTGDYVRIPFGKALDRAATLTVSIWARLDAGAGARKHLMASKWQVNKREWHFDIQPDRTFELEFGDSTGIIQGNWRSKAPVATPEAWHHYGAVFDHGTVRLYLDGSEAPGAVAAGSIPALVSAFGSDVNIGTNSIDSTLNFQGGLDEFRLYSTAKPADWMAMEFRTGNPAP